MRSPGSYQRNKTALLTALAPIVAGLSIAGAPSAGADYLQDTGFTILKDQRVLISSGAGLEVGQVEAASAAFRPDLSSPEFSGKNLDGAPSANSNAHATTVGIMFYGNTGGLAPRVKDIDVLDHNTFLTSGGLRVGTRQAPLNLKLSVINNSWIAAYGHEPYNIEAIRRLDLMIDRDDVVVINALDNVAGSAFPKLLASSYNGITVGVTSGEHSAGPANLDGSQRSKPDLVAPASTTSYGAAMVSGAAALLRSEAKARKMDLGAMGSKALLMAGAERGDEWHQGSESSSDDLTHPLDPVYGAGSLRVDRSFKMLVAKEQNPGKAKSAGWDEHRLPKKAKQGQSYQFTLGGGADDFTAVLAWNREVTRDSGGWLESNLIDLDLALYRKNGRKWKPVDRSSSDLDNVEMLLVDDLPRGIYSLKVTGDRAEDYAIAWSTNLGYPGDNSGPSMSSLPRYASLYEAPAGGGLSGHAVPEPSSALLLATGAGLLMRRRRR